MVAEMKDVMMYEGDNIGDGGESGLLNKDRFTARRDYIYELITDISVNL